MDRKYRQSGYQDGAARAPGGGGSGGDDRPARLEGAPKGRGADRHRDEVFRCKSCGERGDVDVPPGATCKKCGAALHACVQCRHFDTAAHYQCRKEIPAPVPSKTRANDCAFYEATISMDLKGRSSVGAATPDHARSAFDRLFGKK